MSELRFEELRGEEVVYAIHRQERTFLPSRDHCPLDPARPGREPTEGAVVVVGVDDHLGGAERRLERGEAVVEHGDLECRERDLGLRSPRLGGVERAVLARRQERAVLAVDRIDDLLAAQLLEAQLAHAGGRARRGRVTPADAGRGCRGSAHARRF